MRKFGTNELREMYLSFFESKDHLRAESAPLVPQGDASLLFINSGMAPLKPYFTGEVKPPSKRMTTCQKCVRVIDIDRVGVMDRYCTFFEMLGHFSFGDYFKREAIKWTWEFFTQVVGFDPSLLYCSVYEEDDESWDIWTKEMGIDPARVIRLGKDDNFWDVGSGPCGPCSEIYFDRGAENGCGDPDCKPGCDCDRFVEIGNNVFTQFNNDGQGGYTPLAQKNIDFGMGLERLACVVQGADSVYSIDTMQSILQTVAKTAGKKYNDDKNSDISLRVITDHIRTVTMMVCDGVLPSNEGRGYVLRRLLRRAARHGRLLEIKDAFLHELCDAVIETSGKAYPELVARREHIKRVIRVEEERFEQTIDAGLKILNDIIDKLEADGGKVMSGEDTFKLYDTYGFPVVLIEEILTERGLSHDSISFDRLMNEQRERARKAHAALGDFAWDKDSGAELKDTPNTRYVGYDTLTAEAKILRILDTQTVSEGEKATLVLDTTPFYAESGGQVADTGVLENEYGVFAVSAVIKTKDGHYLHMGEITSGELSNGMTVSAKVDTERRGAVMRAHSATHLLQKALRDVLGTHIEQAGSLVEPDKLRFDFTHYSHLTEEESAAVRERVIDYIYQGLDVSVSEMPLDEARAKGALALFGEKYGSTVRVVGMGDVSVELCGGTHIDNTAKIGAFAMKGDASVAAGVRRIEAMTGKEVMRRLNSISTMIDRTAAMLKVPPDELPARIEQHLGETRTLRKAFDMMKTKQIRLETDSGLMKAHDINGLHVLTLMNDSWDADMMRMAGDNLRDKDSDVVAVVASTADDKLMFAAVCGKNAVAKGVKAGDIIKKVCAATGGSGGGRPDSAMGGGKDISKVKEALAMVDEIVKSITS
ncbi:MAG: alanine--tRNA ligase [Oscillospiraceae bacterium]|nr:alanine--tRNA ligase [Oscillospiraceae bacterium]